MKKAAIQQFISPLTTKFYLFIGFNVVLINLVLMAVFLTRYRDLSWFSTEQFLRAIQREQDSWRAMKEAYEYILSPHQEGLYTEIFFNRKVKFQYPPSSLLFFQAFRLANTVIGISWTKLLVAVSWISVVVTAFFSIQIFNWSSRQHLAKEPYAWKIDLLLKNIALFILAITFYPVIKAYSLGQIQAWVNCFFTIAVWCWITNRKTSAGVLVALMCLIKPQYALILVWGVLRRQWNFVLSAFSVISVGLLMSIRWLGLNEHLDYLKVLSFISRHGEAFYPNQSINGLLNRLFFNGNNKFWVNDAFAPYHPFIHVATLMTSLVLVTAALFWMLKIKVKKDEISDVFDFSIIVLTSTMASPVAWEHHYGILLPIYALLFPLLMKKPVLGKQTMLYLVISYILTSNFLKVLNAFANIPVLNVVQSYLFFGALVVLGCLYAIKFRAMVETQKQPTSVMP
jgi:alpha-1,2-mannosyltransferase